MASSDIEYVKKIVPDAYHGTSLENATNIDLNGFKASDKTDTYLGYGVYFFEASEWHAWKWAESIRKYENPVVFKATIDLGKCLDLHNYEHRALLKKVGDKIKGRGKEPLSDGEVINFIATEITDVDSVRAGFVKPDWGTVFEGSRLHDYHQLIICVRSSSCILNKYAIR